MGVRVRVTDRSGVLSVGVDLGLVHLYICIVVVFFIRSLFVAPGVTLRSTRVRVRVRARVSVRARVRVRVLGLGFWSALGFERLGSG